MPIHQPVTPKVLLGRGVSVLLMLLIPCLTCLHVIAHKKQRKEVKRFLERSVGMELSEDLFLPATAEYEFLKKGDEIFVGENKYDVLKVEIVEGGYRVKAFNDTIEKALENQISQQTECGSKGASKAQSLWFKQLHWDHWYYIIGVRSSVNLDVLLKDVNSYDLTSVALSVPTPPPENFS